MKKLVLLGRIVNFRSVRRIFQCYGRGDKELADQFRASLTLHLRGLPPQMRCEYWFDGEILCGDDWEEVILQKLAESEIGIVLISPSLLASDFIRRVELPQLMAGGKLVMPVLLSPVISRADYQGLNAKQIYAREVSGQRQSFLEQKTGADQQAFVIEFCDQLLAQVEKSNLSLSS